MAYSHLTNRQKELLREELRLLNDEQLAAFITGTAAERRAALTPGFAARRSALVLARDSAQADIDAIDTMLANLQL
jgi:hypothetical protein